MEKQLCDYKEVHTLLQRAKTSLLASDTTKRPEAILAISGGGLIPARILRTVLGAPTIPIYSVGIHTYHEDTCQRADEEAEFFQWLEPTTIQDWAQRKFHVVVCDDVDDTGNTIQKVTKRLHHELVMCNVEPEDAKRMVTVVVLHQKDRLPLGLGKQQETYHHLQIACAAGIPKETWLEYAWE